MRFMLIANADRNSEAGLPPDPRLMAAIGQMTQEMVDSGKVVGFGGLLPSATGAAVRVANGQVTVTDGPFAETKEIVGGFVIVDVASKEEAVEMARRFWQVHADILGPSYEGGGQIRQMYGQGDGPCGETHPAAS
jgi:hypothetical protein